LEETGINTDKALFERIATGDETAFSIIFFRYTARLAPFVTQLLQSDSWSEEIVRDVFLRLWQSRLQLATIEHPTAYAVKLLRVKHIIPFHYGTFAGYAQTPDEFLSLTDQYPESKIHILKAGETIRYNGL
jgi:hypothetical protein